MDTVGETLILAESVSKKFCRDSKRAQWYGLTDTYGFSRNPTTLRKGEFWAVQDININIRRGECLGLLGHNGAGKSTILKILTGLIRPDVGMIKMKGRVSALIELGTGFNPIMTGRENIYNNGATLGLTKKQINSKLEAIIEFSGLSQVIDTPIQYYSSGMKVRLGFAVATQMESDIMLIDEVLSVGDMNFVLRCFNRMDELLPKTAVILVSHSIPNIARVSTTVGVMNGGRMIHYGKDVSTGINKYHELFQPEVSSFQAGDDALLISAFVSSEEAKNQTDPSFPAIAEGMPFTLEIKIQARKNLKACGCYLAFQDITMRNIAEVLNGTDKDQESDMSSGEILTYKAFFNNNPLAQGVFSIAIGFYGKLDGIRRMIFRNPAACHFKIESGKQGWSSVCLNPKWSVEEDQRSEI